MFKYFFSRFFDKQLVLFGLTFALIFPAHAQFQNRGDALAQRDSIQTQIKALQLKEAGARSACSKELLAKRCEATVKAEFGPQRTELKGALTSANQYLRTDKANAATARIAKNEASAAKRAAQAQSRAKTSEKRRADHAEKMKVKDAKRAERLANPPKKP